MTRNDQISQNFNKHFLILASASLLIMPSLVIANWKSPYLGAYLGGAFGSANMSANISNTNDSSYFSSPPESSALIRASTGSIDTDTFIAGVLFGQDWQWHQYVFGLTMDYGAFTLDATKTSATLNNNTNSSWLFTLRGRIGYQIPSKYELLSYVTGGMALSNMNLSTQYADDSSYAGIGNGSTNQDSIGWTVGAGFEWMPKPIFALILEYEYVDFPSITNTTLISNSQAGFGIPSYSLNSEYRLNSQLSASVIKFGASYHFVE